MNLSLYIYNTIARKKYFFNKLVFSESYTYLKRFIIIKHEVNIIQVKTLD